MIYLDIFKKWFDIMIKDQRTFKVSVGHGLDKYSKK